MRNLKSKDFKSLQKHLTTIEKILADLARLHDIVTEKDKTKVLLRSLPENFGFVALMADENKMNYDFICALLNLEMEREKAHHNSSASVKLDA